MKKIAKISLLATVFLLLTILLCSCGGGGGGGDHAGTVTLVIAGEPETVFTADLAGMGASPDLMTVLGFLKEQGKLTYSETSGPYGSYLTAVGNLSAGAANEYIAIYTDCPEDADVTAFAKTRDYHGKTLTSSGVGASFMHMKDGVTVVIALETF